MQLTRALNPRATPIESVSGQRRSHSAKLVAHGGSKEAVAEINAYIAIRDIYLAEAEEVASDATLYRAGVANDLVATCVKPARSPYEAQHLPEAEAVRERARCETVKARLAELARATAA